MSAYGGYIQFQNLTRENITTGTAYHQTSDYGTDSIDLAGLPAGGISAPVPFFSSTSNSDTWGFEVTTASNTTYKASVGQAFHSGNAGSTVILQACVANESTRTFNVFIPPSASSSNDTSF